MEGRNNKKAKLLAEREKLIADRKAKMKRLPTAEDFARQKREDSVIVVAKGGSAPKARTVNLERENAEIRQKQEANSKKHSDHKAKSEISARKRATESEGFVGLGLSKFSSGGKKSKRKSSTTLPSFLGKEEPGASKKDSKRKGKDNLAGFGLNSKFSLSGKKPNGKRTPLAPLMEEAEETAPKSKKGL